MLVLSRKRNEAVLVTLGETVIRFTVVDIRGGGKSGRSVRVGIEAPREIPVHREEVWLAIQRDVLPGPGPASSPGREQRRPRKAAG